MRVVKNEKGFPAVLKDTQGRILAEGYGVVLPEHGEVEFRSDFVPLYRMGVPLKIVRRFDGQDIHLFIGEVYISDMQLLRLMHVRDLLLPGSEKIYSTQVDIPSTFVLAEVQEYLANHHGWFSLFRRNKQEEPRPAPEYPAQLTALSGRQIEFHSEYLLETGDDILMTFTPEPDVSFDSVPVRVDKVYAFGEGVAYVATFGMDMPRWQRERLDSYLRKLNEEKNRFFPDQPAAEPDPEPESPGPEAVQEPSGPSERTTPDPQSDPAPRRLDLEI